MSENTVKNILYVENGIGYGGAIICLRHLVKHLDRSRYKALVITGRTGPQYREIAEEADWRHIPDRHIDVVGLRHRLQQSVWPQRIPGLSWLLNQLLARADDVFNFLPFFLHLWWVAWRYKADLVHANNDPICNRAALLVGKLLHIPIVCHIRGDLDDSRLMRWANTLPDHFVSVSHWIAKGMQQKLRIPAEKISVIYDGIALEKLDLNADGHEFRRRHTIPAEAYAVGLVGLLMPWKGQALFLDAAKLLREQIPGLKMVIVGGTPDDCVSYEAMLRQRVIQEQLEDIIIFTGHITQMEQVYNGLDVVVSASISPEPLGTMVIECMAMGRPLIGPNHGGAAEMMAHDKTGLLFTPNDAESLAAEITRFYRDRPYALQLGHNARDHALATFAVGSHVDKIQTLYDSILQ